MARSVRGPLIPVETDRRPRATSALRSWAERLADLLADCRRRACRPPPALMAVLLALSSAVMYGVADFLGGVSSRRISAWTVVVGAQACGLVALLVVWPFLPPATVARADLVWGGAAGLAGAIGLVQYFRGLAVGSMAVVAPISAVVSGAVPVVVGVALGERPPAVAWIGIAVALPAIVLISREHSEASTRTGAVVAALAAGMAFGCFYVFIDRTGDGAGVVPVVAARTASVAALLAAGAATARLRWPRRPLLAVIAGSGVLDVVANVLFLYAVREGLLAVGAVIVALYPASTIVLARAFLHERLQRIQLVGVAAAAVAVALVAVA